MRLLIVHKPSVGDAPMPFQESSIYIVDRQHGITLRASVFSHRTLLAFHRQGSYPSFWLICHLKSFSVFLRYELDLNRKW